MNKSRAKRLAERKRRIAWRLRGRSWPDQARPMLKARHMRYERADGPDELTDRARGLGEGGIGLMHRLALRTGLVNALDRRLHRLKRHLHRLKRHLHLLKKDLPYHESDHVLNIAYNSLCGGTCLDDMELRRAARGVQTAVVEPVAERAPACGGHPVPSVADRRGPPLSAALLSSHTGAGVRMPRLAWAFVNTQRGANAANHNLPPPKRPPGRHLSPRAANAAVKTRIKAIYSRLIWG